MATFITCDDESHQCEDSPPRAVWRVTSFFNEKGTNSYHPKKSADACDLHVGDMVQDLSSKPARRMAAGDKFEFAYLRVDPLTSTGGQ